MVNQLNHNPIRAVDGNGNPVSGALARFYDVNTVTEQTVYSDSALSAVHAQPLVADSSGIFPQVFTAGAVQTKVNVTDSSGVTLPGFPLDPANSIPLSTSGASAISFSPPAWSSSTTVQDAIEEVHTKSLQNVVEDTTPQLGGVLDTNGSRIDHAFGADLTSAATLVIGSDGNSFNVNGTTTIAAFSSAPAGTKILLRFVGVLTLTHHATNLILPSGADIVTAANDIGQFVSEGGGKWRCTGYLRADGKALAQSAIIDADFTSSEQTITNGSGLNVAHGLGAKPSRVDAVLLCKTAEDGWAVDDEIRLPSKDAVSSSIFNFILGWDATNVTVVTCASGVQAANKSTGATAILTNGNWRIVVRAWA